jgi:hypothetical protein
MKSFDLRNRELFLRNSFYGTGKYGIPVIYRQEPDLKNLAFIGFHNTTLKDTKNNHKTVHFFKDDITFNRVWTNPARYIPSLRQYKQVLSPVFSGFINIPPAEQIHNVFKRQWCGAYWQRHGITVIPAVGWGSEESFKFCFDGIEKGATVAVSALGSKKIWKEWIAGFKMMCEKIDPRKVICYCSPFAEVFQMADVAVVPYEGVTARRERLAALSHQKDLPGLSDGMREAG